MILLDKHHILQTKVVHIYNKNGYDIYIGRPSQWGNPFRFITESSTPKDLLVPTRYICTCREEAIDKYEEWITQGEGQQLLKYLHELVGKRLACWCSPKACHGDVLVKLVHQHFNKGNL